MRTFVTAALFLATAAAGGQVSPETHQKITQAAIRILQDTGVPSASIGVMLDGKLVYSEALGFAHLRPNEAALANMAYPIGSISKQFTATAVLLLEQDGKLSLDDKVAKYFPELTRANDITIRNLLTMTSGYEDYAPQDYIIPAWLKEEKPINVIHVWATKPLDFEPGTQWQYSNTNFVLAALIVEKVSGQPLAEFLRKRVFQPAGLGDVINTYTQRDKLRVTGYVSYALAPPREQPLEAPGWYYGDGDLAMSATTLLFWDRTLIDQSLLLPRSYDEMKASFHLKDGTDTNYGLGIYSRTRDHRREIEHGGEVGGFVAENVVYPDDRAAIVVLTNEVASSAASQIAAAIKPFLFPRAASSDPAAGDTLGPELNKILTGFQTGQIDRTLFTADANAYFDKAALADFQSTLAPLGAVTTVVRTFTHDRGGMTGSVYKASFSHGAVTVSIYVLPDGKIEQLLIVGKT